MKIAIVCIGVLMTFNTHAQKPEENLVAMGIVLPAEQIAVANYINAVRVGNLLYLSGKGPRQINGEYVKGKLGKDLTLEQGYEAAKLTAINQLSVLKFTLGNLSKVKRIIKVNGYVNSADDFYDQPKVINGFSDLMMKVFGDAGKHARTALGVNTLPFNMAVEVEMIVEIKESE